jgi:hypothetical protein
LSASIRGVRLVEVSRLNERAHHALSFLRSMSTRNERQSHPADGTYLAEPADSKTGAELRCL